MGDMEGLPQKAVRELAEPDVLERGKVYFDEHFTEEGPIPRELCSDVERLLADAIAEIKKLLKRSERQSARFESVCEIHQLAEADLLKAYEDTEQLEKVNRSLVEANFTLIEQLRAIMEADPVAIYTLQDDGEKRGLCFTDEKDVKIYHALRLAQIGLARQTMPVDPGVQALCDELREMKDRLRTGEHIYLFAVAPKGDTEE